jgi:hypothetical protein
MGRIRQGNQIPHPHASETYGKRHLGASVAVWASCAAVGRPNISASISKNNISEMEHVKNSTALALPFNKYQKELKTWIPQKRKKGGQTPTRTT